MNMFENWTVIYFVLMIKIRLCIQNIKIYIFQTIFLISILYYITNFNIINSYYQKYSYQKYFTHQPPEKSRLRNPF